MPAFCATITGLPLISTAPDEGLTKPMMLLNSVLLPLPFTPTNPAIVPPSKPKLASRNASCPFA